MRNDHLINDSIIIEKKTKEDEADKGLFIILNYVMTFFYNRKT